MFVICLIAKISGSFLSIPFVGKMHVVVSGSMASKNEANQYLMENNLNNQFDIFDLIMIESISNDIMAKVQSTDLPADKLQGFVAEIWHSGTFNADSAVHHSAATAKAPDVNTYASADVEFGGSRASLKYYKDAKSSYAAQSETPYERYMHLKAKAEKTGKSYESLEEFLGKRKIKKEDMHKSMYQGQAKLIPTNQLLDAQKLLDKKIAVAQANGKLDQVARYREVQATLTDILSDKKGNKSILFVA